jgi:hypothetical protein
MAALVDMLPNSRAPLAVLDLAHKRNDIAFCATPEAVIELLLGIN